MGLQSHFLCRVIDKRLRLRREEQAGKLPNLASKGQPGYAVVQNIIWLMMVNRNKVQIRTLASIPCHVVLSKGYLNIHTMLSASFIQNTWGRED